MQLMDASLTDIATHLIRFFKHKTGVRVTENIRDRGVVM